MRLRLLPVFRLVGVSRLLLKNERLVEGVELLRTWIFVRRHGDIWGHPTSLAGVVDVIMRRVRK